MVKALRCPVAVPGTMSEKRSCKSDEVADFEMPTKLAKRTKLTDNAPVHIGLQRFSDNSKLCGLPGSQEKVCVLMMEHKAKPGHFFRFAESFGSFLVATHTEKNAFPETMEAFEKRYEVSFVMVSVHPASVFKFVRKLFRWLCFCFFLLLKVG